MIKRKSKVEKGWKGERQRRGGVSKISKHLEKEKLVEKKKRKDGNRKRKKSRDDGERVRSKCVSKLCVSSQ